MIEIKRLTKLKVESNFVEYICCELEPNITKVDIISWKGTCEVHEQFNDEEINYVGFVNVAMLTGE